MTARRASKAARSWAHTIRPRRDGEKTCLGNSTNACARGRHCPGRTFRATRSYVADDEVARWYEGDQAQWIISYRYITGRAGRVTTREQGLCDRCAEKFCGRHGIAWPPITAEEANP